MSSDRSATHATGSGNAAALCVVIRNIPILVSVAQKFRVQGITALISAGLRALPPSFRKRLTPVLIRIAPIIAALAEAASGHQEQSVALLRAAASRGRKNAAVDAAVVLHQTALAREIAQDVHQLRLTTLARLLAEEGAYSHAIATLKSGPRMLRRSIGGELAALHPQSRIEIDPTPISATAPVTGVCHFVTTALPEAQTGYTLRTQGITEAQARHGLDVNVISRLGFPVDQGYLGASRSVLHHGVTYRRLLPFRALPLSAGERLDRSISEARKLISAVETQVLHAHSKHDNAQVAIAVGRSLGIPVVYEARGFLEETWRSRGGDAASERYLLARGAETDCMAAADAVVTLSETMRSQIIARGIPAEKVHLVPNAVNAAFLGEPQPSDAMSRATLNVPDHARILGMAGTINTYEGLETVIRALAKLAAPDVVLVVVGDGPDRHRLEALATDLGVEARFTGRVPHAAVRDLVSTMDLFCVPRVKTAVTALVPPMKPLEALASAVPVIVSDVPPLAELLGEADGAGWMVPAGDVDAWAECLRHRLYDQDALTQAGLRGRSWVTANRTWNHVAKRYARVYAKALAAQGVLEA